MQKLAAFASACALVLAASSAIACDFHKMHVTSIAPAEETVAMSTYDGRAPLPILPEEAARQPIAQATAQAAAQDCPVGAAECAPLQE